MSPGVEDQQIVGRSSPRGVNAAHAPVGEKLIVHGKRGRRMAGLGNSDPKFDFRQRGANLLHRWREGRVEHDRLRVGVVEEIDELIGHIAVVRIDRRKARLEGGEIGLKVFRGVVEIGGDLGLPGQPTVQKPARQAIGAAVKVAPGDDPITPDLGGAIRDGIGHGFPQVGIVPHNHDATPRVSSLARIGPTAGRRVNARGYIFISDMACGAAARTTNSALTAPDLAKVSATGT